jgi:hypothetical protein
VYLDGDAGVDDVEEVVEGRGGGGMVEVTVGRTLYPCAAGVARNSGSSNEGSSADTGPCTLLVDDVAALMGVGEENS